MERIQSLNQPKVEFRMGRTKTHRGEKSSKYNQCDYASSQDKQWRKSQSWGEKWFYSPLLKLGWVDKNTQWRKVRKMVPFYSVEIRMGGAQLSLLMGGSHSLWDPLLIWGDISVEKQEDQSLRHIYLSVEQLQEIQIFKVKNSDTIWLFL